jgi:NTE family protein
MAEPRKKIAIGCQGGGMHAAFAVGVLTEILKDLEHKNRFELIGLSGTSAGALCALMTWYGLAPNAKRNGSPAEAIRQLNAFWDQFVATTAPETLLNFMTFGLMRAEEFEVPVLGVNAPILGFNPAGAIAQMVASSLPALGVRKEYFELVDTLTQACPDFDTIKWPEVTSRVLVGATEVVQGFETVFDSDVNKGLQTSNPGRHPGHPADYWRQQLELTFAGVAASGTLPVFSEAERIHDSYYWDGLYSQNPPVREFFAGVPLERIPNELWIIRINPQQWPRPPKFNKEVIDRQNELTGNLSLNQELYYIMKVNEWIRKHKGFATSKKPVTIRSIKMTKKTADDLAYSSKFDRSRTFLDQLREEGRAVAKDWISNWPNVGAFPQDAGY